MRKELLLAKSNIRKGKGLTIGLVLLILLAAAFLNLVLVIFTDFNSNVNRTAERLHTEDAKIYIDGDLSNLTDSYLESLVDKDEVNDYEIMHTNIFYNINTKYGEGEVSPQVMFETKDHIMNAKLGKTEIIDEDDSITENYIYLPYQYYTGGGFKVGDKIDLTIIAKDYTFTIKGFLNNITFGSYNTGTIITIVDDDTYKELNDKHGKTNEMLLIKFDLKDDVNARKFVNSFSKKISEKDYTLRISDGVLEDYIFGRTYVALIIGVSFLALSVIILGIVFLMLSNSISNYIKENIKIIGAIKAIGFTSNNIKLSFLIQFVVLSTIGVCIGLVVSYLMLPFVANIITTQVGMPYNVGFNLMCCIATIISIIVLIIVTVLLCVRKTNKIEPIAALRDGISTHNFKKNRVEIEKSKLSLNLILALKTMFTNMKQNIITFIVVGLLVFCGTISLVMMQNFSIKPKLSLLSFELCDGAIVADSDKELDIFNYTKTIDHVQNVRLCTNSFAEVEDTKLLTYVINNDGNLKNQDVCYEGRLPKYDNEIAVAGKFASNYEHKIGDEIELGVGNRKEKFLITGLIQTTNNNGTEAVIIEDGGKKIFGEDFVKVYFFDIDDGGDVDKILDDVKDKFGERISSTINFEKIMEGSITIFKTISNLMVVAMLSVSGLVILLVLYLLIKTLINNKKKDYGILKAVGFTSRNVVMQNAISFMPPIILSTICSCILSSRFANAYLTLMMRAFGIMKATFEVPVEFVVYMGIGFMLVSFIFAILLSRKIRKIEPVDLLKGE